jgi:hypothetical protein
MNKHQRARTVSSDAFTPAGGHYVRFNPFTQSMEYWHGWVDAEVGKGGPIWLWIPDHLVHPNDVELSFEDTWTEPCAGFLWK